LDPLNGAAKTPELLSTQSTIALAEAEKSKYECEVSGQPESISPETFAQNRNARR